MRAGDVDAVERLSAETYFHLERRTRPGDWPPAERRTPEQSRRWRALAAHLVQHDGPGCWVAEDGSHLLGITLSFKRDVLWGLAAYAVSPAAQGRGVGTALLDTTLAYSRGCVRGMLVSSHDPHAARHYRRSGFTLHPSMLLCGTVDRSMLPVPERVRGGTAADADLCDSVDRHTRGAAHGVDHVLMSRQYRLIVIDHTTGNGYCYVSAAGAPYLLAATNRRTAGRLLWECLAASGRDPVAFGPLTSSQEWALDIGLASGLGVHNRGYLALRNMKPPTPYIPSNHLL
jgi:GNAT superfamily N-acetyltransferase